MIRFTKSSITELEEKYVVDALYNGLLSGDGKYTKAVYEQFKNRMGIERMLLTTSGTTALEMASILIDLEPGDEVIAPSFTFSSTINAFILRGAKPVFCDVDPKTMNMDANLIEGLITPKTKAIYCVDYAGVPCDIDAINRIADKYGLFVIEDAAQAVGSKYKGEYCGTLTEFGCYSFHETKNYVMGEGGAIVVNEAKYMRRAEIIREKGTNRMELVRGEVDKYTWHDLGSSFLPSDVLAAILYAQMERFDEIMEKRLTVWNTYQEMLQEVAKEGRVGLLTVPDYAEHNGHMFNIALPTTELRTRFGDEMKKREIAAHICYVPLHSAPMGRKLSEQYGIKYDCPITEDYGSRVIRLPLHAGMTKDDAVKVAENAIEVLRSF